CAVDPAFWRRTVRSAGYPQGDLGTLRDLAFRGWRRPKIGPPASEGDGGGRIGTAGGTALAGDFDRLRGAESSPLGLQGSIRQRRDVHQAKQILAMLLRATRKDFEVRGTLAAQPLIEFGQ